MSKKVDERVVEMRFDNSQFESNVKTSMSTLEKLKSSLNFKGASKGLDNISSAAGKVNFSGMASGIETVNAKFSSMQIVGMTALSNITSAAMQAGTNLVKSLTLDPVISGFQEYETQLNAVQTILSNTKSKGSTIDDVTAALDELNEYADLTIYNFTEMTRNIGTFTAAGVGLKESVSAIKGIANLAAASGSSSAQASTAMYQLSQALAAGRVSLMDWNSVVNAGMGGELFQNALIRTARVMGTGVDAALEKYGTFRESLTRGQWLTADVLTETLSQIAGAYDEAELRAQGYSESQIKEILDLADTATKAATEIKTFSQLMGTVSEAIGSGWAKTWQLIFGDFEEAKTFWTGLWNDSVSPMIEGMSDARNSLIEGAMGGGENRWDEFVSKVNEAGVSVEEFQAKLSEVANEKGISLDGLITEYGSLYGAISSGKISVDMIIETFGRLASSTTPAADSTQNLNDKLTYFQDVVDKVWRGDFKNAPERYQLLADAGYDYAKVQELVNKTVDGHRLTLEDLSDAQLASIGYTEEEITKIRALADEAEKAGTPLNDLINSITTPKKSGRELFLDSLLNIFNAIVKPLSAIKDAFDSVFSINSDQLYDLIAAFNEFTKRLVISDDDAKNLEKTFKGLFSIIHLITSSGLKVLSVVLKGVDKVLGLFGTNLLEVTGTIGEMIYNFDQFVSSGNLVEQAISGIGDVLSYISKPLADFFNSFATKIDISKSFGGITSILDKVKDYLKSFEGLSIGDVFKKIADDAKNAFNNLKKIKWEDVLDGLSNFGEKVREVFKKLIEDIKEVGPNVLDGLKNGLKDGVEGIVSFMRDLASKMVEAVCALLGIHSPSTVFFDIGKNIIDGLCNGIEYFSGRVTSTLSKIIEDVKGLMSNIDWGAVLTVGAGVGSFIVLYQLTDALQTFATGLSNFSAPFKSAAGVMDSVKNAINTFVGANTSSKGFKNVADGIKVLAEAIAILAGSVAVLSALDPNKLWQAVGVIAALAGIIGLLAVALNRFAGGGTVLESIQLNSLLLSLAGSFLLFSVAAKIIGTMEWEDLEKAATGLIVFGAVVAGLVAITEIGGDSIEHVPSLIGKISGAFLLLAIAAKIIGTMSWEDLGKAGVGLVVFGGVVTGLVAATKLAGNDIDKASDYIMKIAAAFVLLGVAAKIIGGMSWEEMGKAGAGIAGFAAIITGLIAATKLMGDKTVDAIGKTMIEIAGAMMLLAVTAKLLAGMSFEEMGKAAVGFSGLLVVIGIMVAITNLAPTEQIAKVGLTLLAMSVCIGILAGVAALLGMIDTNQLVKGIVAITALAAIMSAMTYVTKFASGDAQGTMMGLAVAIGVMAASLVALSFIDARKLATATAALSAVMGMFALVIKATGNVGKSMGTIITMTVALGLLGGLLYLLAGLPIESTLGASLALSTLLLALSASLKILEGVGKVSGSALASMGVLTLVVAGIGAVLGLLSYFKVEASLTTTAAISTLLIAMSGVCLILSNIKSVSPMALAAMGALTLVVAGLGVILGLMSYFNIAPSLETALSLSVLLLAMSGAMAILSLIGAASAAAIAGAGAMVAVVAIIAAAVAAFGAIQQIPGVDWIMNEGATFLKNLGNAIGQFVGGIAGGAMEGMSDSFPQIAQNLSDFITNLQPFIDGVKGLDPSIGEGVGSLATAILTLTGAGLVDAIASFIGGGDSFQKLGENLSLLGDAVVSFSNTTAGVNAEALTMSANATKALIEALTQIPNSGGILGDLLGGKDYSAFATGLSSIGNAVNSFYTTTSGINSESLSSSANATKTLIQAISTVPNSGGMLGDLLGGKDYTGFAIGLSSIGAAVNSFYTVTSGVNLEAVTNGANATKTLIQAISTIPNSGGFLEDLLGGKDYTGFAVGLASIGRAVSSFSTSTAGVNYETLNMAITSTGNLISALSAIPTEGGLLQDLLGGGADYSGFSSGLASIGSGIKTYSDKVSGIDFGIISSSTNSIKTLISFATSIAESGESISAGANNVRNIGSIGDSVRQYADKVSGIDFGSISASISAIRQLMNLINSMVGLDSSGIGTFKAAIDELATVNLTGVINAFSSAVGQFNSIGFEMMNHFAAGIRAGQSVVMATITAAMTVISALIKSKQAEFHSMGLTLISRLAAGMTSGRSMVVSSVSSVLGSAASNIRSYYSSFYSAGSYISQGLAAGMRSQLASVRTAAAEISNLAAQAARDAAGIASPSRVFYEIGGYMGEGLVNALGDYQRVSYRAGYDVADSASTGLSKAISKVGSLLESDIDMNPKITPVLDLSNIENGVGDLSNLLNATGAVDVIGNVNSINRRMNQMNQNGVSFGDVVKAIDKLRGDVSDISRPTYSIDRITYDDGSAVAGAVENLIRATRMERRV